MTVSGCGCLGWPSRRDVRDTWLDRILRRPEVNVVSTESNVVCVCLIYLVMISRSKEFRPCEGKKRIYMGSDTNKK